MTSQYSPAELHKLNILQTCFCSDMQKCGKFLCSRTQAQVTRAISPTRGCPALKAASIAVALACFYVRIQHATGVCTQVPSKRIPLIPIHLNPDNKHEYDKEWVPLMVWRLRLVPGPLAA